jgi:hypothetical protein
MLFAYLGIGLVLGIITGLCVNINLTLEIPEKDSKAVRRALVAWAVILFLILVLDLSKLYYAGANTP